MNEFDPNDIGVNNGNIFGFPVTELEAKIVIIPVPWDATASYKKGTALGPKSILKASTQLDFFDPYLEHAYTTKVFLAPISSDWSDINSDLSQKSLDYLSDLENKGKSVIEEYKELISEINKASSYMNQNLFERCRDIIQFGKIPAVLGGEHSVPFGLIKALDSTYDSFGILQIDAHADLRDSYEEFKYSHASIMYNVIKECKNLKKLVQLGIRDISQNEIDFIASNRKIKTYFDWDLKKNEFQGMTWEKQCVEIIESLPENIYISFDIDGLTPYLCPSTGTPVPGGLSFSQIEFLFYSISKSNKKIIGFDLSEVSPGINEDWDANVGARILWKLVCLTEICRKKNE